LAKGVKPKFQLGVLDLCKRTDRISAQQSLAETLELASYVEGLGYHRYWVAEHHTDDASQSSPEVLLPLLASRTRNMRIGAAAILLRYYSPLKVAEVFLTLEALFPGRIELGVARGPGVTSNENALALVDGSEDWLIDGRYARKISDLCAYLGGRGPTDPRFAAVRARPLGASAPVFWIMGSGSDTVRASLQHSTPLAFSLFLQNTDAYGPGLLEEYRTKFAPTATVSAPRVVLAVSAICAESAAAAHKLNADLTNRGYYSSNVIGTPGQCKVQLEQIAQNYVATEFVVATWLTDFEARAKTYELIAKACDR
jgi:luciferase family oxidoreductase group 1